MTGKPAMSASTQTFDNSHGGSKCKTKKKRKKFVTNVREVTITAADFIRSRV